MLVPITYDISTAACVKSPSAASSTVSASRIPSLSALWILRSTSCCNPNFVS